MQLIHLLISTSSVYLVAKYSPFSRLQKALIPFGYFFVYEYSIIARPYSLTVLVVILAVIFYKKFPYRIVLFALILAVMSNIHSYGFVFVAAFTVLIVYKVWLARKGNTLDQLRMNRLIIAFTVIGVGIVLASIQVIRSQTEFVVNYLRWSGGFNYDHFVDTLKKALTAFCPFPPMDGVNIWNKFILDSLQIGRAHV